MKRLLSLLLSLVIFVTSLSCGINAFAQNFGLQDIVPPKFASSINSNIDPIVSKKLGYDVSKVSQSSKYKDNTYYTTGRTLYVAMRNAMVVRQKNMSLHMMFDHKLRYFSNEINSVLREILDAATSDELSVSDRDGDYINWQYTLISPKYGDVVAENYNNMYYYDIDLTFYYRTTAQQEKEVTSVVNSFVDSLDTSTMSDYEILKAIHDFILSKSYYDYQALNDIYGNDKKYDYAYTAWGTLVKGRSVCQGYALAFYRIAKDLGYKVRFVYSDPYVGCHSWNIIELNGKYYYVDTTWDDDEYEEDKYRYFLVDYDSIRENDYTEKGKATYAHTLDPEQQTDYFKNTYERYIDDEDYERDNQKLLSNCVVSLSQSNFTYDGVAKKPSVVVTNKEGTVIPNTDYKISYSSNIKSGYGKVKITGKNGYLNSNSHRQIKILPKKANSLSYKTNTRTTDSITFNYTLTDSGSTGYTVYVYKNSKWTALKSTSASSVTVSGLTSGELYKFRVAEYKHKGARVLYGAKGSTFTTTPKPITPTGLSLTEGKSAISVSWQSVNCDAYQIQYSRKSDMTGSKTKTVDVPKTSYKLTGLASNNKYYVRIRAVKYKTLSDGRVYNYYSAWSSKKTVTVK